MALRITIAALLLGSLTLCLAGCGGGGGGNAVATVTGRVVDDGSLDGIASATVRVGDADRDTTGADGRFSVFGAPTGSQTLTITAAGYSTYTDGVWLIEGTNALGTLYVPPTLQAGTGAITGTLFLSDGTAVGGGTAQTATASAVTRSDGTGRFTIYNVPAGTPQVNFSDPVSGETAWAYVTVTAGATANVGKVTLSSGPPAPPY